MDYDKRVVALSPALTTTPRYCSSTSKDLVHRVKQVSFNLAVESTKTLQSANNNYPTARAEKRGNNETRNQHGQQARTRHCQQGSRSTRQLRRNERERGRKARLNAAFQVLKSVVPDNIHTTTGSSDRKLTQVEILRLAKNYISNLTELLRQDTNISFATFKTE